MVGFCRTGDLSLMKIVDHNGKEIWTVEVCKFCDLRIDTSFYSLHSGLQCSHCRREWTPVKKVEIEGYSFGVSNNRH